MRCTRIHTHQELMANGEVELDGRSAHYLLRVLRLKTSDPVTLFNGDGHDYPGVVQSVGSRTLLVGLGDRRRVASESALKITLVQAISRGERMDYSLQKATELGVHCIRLLVSNRVEVRLTHKRLEKRLEHWRGVVISACEQSGCALVPDILPPCSLDEYLSHDNGSQRLLLDAGAKQKLSACTLGAHEVATLVGPEGGFTDEEIILARRLGVQAVQLGPRILRTETAGPAAIAVIQAIAGDF